MADYRFSVQPIKRSEGRSAVAAAAYRSGESLYEERTDLIHDYERKQGVEHTEIMAPESAPDWVQSRERLWNNVEAAETRKNSQPAFEFQLSLPHELDLEQRKALVREFVGTELVGRGMVADIAMHMPSRDGDQRNFHAHVLTTTREISPEGFGAKRRDWRDRELLVELRKSWAEHQNRHLEQALGRNAPKVSHLSLAERNIMRPAQIHLGPHASAMERRGVKTDRGSYNRVVRQYRDSRRANQPFREQCERLKHGEMNVGITSLTGDLKKVGANFTRQADSLSAKLAMVMEAKKAIRQISETQIRGQLIKPERDEMQAAKREYEAKKMQANTRAPHKTVMAWLTNPTKQLFRKIARDVALDRAAYRYQTAKKNYDKVAYQLNTPWGRDRIEKMVAEANAPLKDLRKQERQLRQGIAQSRRWAERATKVSAGLETLRDANAAHAVPMPKKVLDVKSLIRSAEQGFGHAYQRLRPEIKQTLGARAARGRSQDSGLGLGIKR